MCREMGVKIVRLVRDCPPLLMQHGCLTVNVIMYSCDLWIINQYKQYIHIIINIIFLYSCALIICSVATWLVSQVSLYCDTPS